MAELMLSQPATKIFLKTTESKAAEWVSNAIGKVEIERMKETHFDGSRSGRNFTIDRQGVADEADELSSQELQNWPGYCSHSGFKIPLPREAYFTHQVVEARIGAERVHKWVKE
jgi:hypothetical protein